jgi:predicted TIM-barrel fold metal-dependent hydrolase
MSEFCAADPDRLKGAMLIPFNHPEVAATEARWAREHGLTIAVSNPTPPADRAWSDRFYDPVWQALDELDVPLALHEITTGCPPHTIGVQRYAPTYQMVYLVTHVVEAALGMADLLVSGTLQRFPRLRVMLAEAHVAWLPGLLALLDYTYETVGAGSPFVKTIASRRGELALDGLPSDYFRRQCTLSAFPDDPLLEEVVAQYPDNIMISTDWPHPVGEGRRSVFDLAAEAETASASPTLQPLLADNALRFFRSGSAEPVLA